MYVLYVYKFFMGKSSMKVVIKWRLNMININMLWWYDFGNFGKKDNLCLYNIELWICEWINGKRSGYKWTGFINNDVYGFDG